ncbi:caspase family protein [Myxococcus xanthus]|uniref:caspase family protein n=1 Tax=Myxococcus xanthus TaxID=34 RepID=UPI00191CD0C2|nr:caspase family protein [Myxococcus xanthus]
MKRKMVALILGNEAYVNGGVLKNPVQDANDVASKMRGFGFHVIVATDASNREMDRKLKEFKALLDSNDVGLFFFAGHGVQIEGSNYLLAVDTELSDETEAKHSSLSLDRVIGFMEKSTVATKIIILDACRNNPWERAWHRAPTARGLAPVYAPKGTIIGFATSPGQTASDGKGRNGTYTSALLQHIDEPDRPIETMFKCVRNTVAAETSGKQISWEHTSLSGDFYFNASLGRSVKTYRETSLADSLFVIDEGRSSHRVIKKLKSLNWYTQNDAIGLLDAKSVNKMQEDNLFVLGRNIYQSACGGSTAAMSFVRSFMDSASGFAKGRRKAILDGMLFEVFFDPRAGLRKKIKGNLFNDVFDLQKHAALRDSFDFIAGTLEAANGDFYVMPGRGHKLDVTVKVDKVSAKSKGGKDAYFVDAIYVGGANVLRIEDDEYVLEGGGNLYSGRKRAAFEEELSQGLIVPSRLLKITYAPAGNLGDVLTVPLGYAVSKA